MTIGSHPGLGGWDAKQFVMAMGYTHHGTFDVLKVHDLTGEYVWSSHALLAPNLIGTWRLDAAFDPTQAAVFEGLFLAGHLYCGFGSRLCVFSQTGLAQTIELPGNIGRLTASRPWTRQRVIASLEDGGVILWDDSSSAPQSRFSEGLGNPYTCLTRGGLLVAAADGALEVYDTRESKLSLLAMKGEPAFHPQGLVATDHPEHFAILVEDGAVLVHSLEARH